jgi:hypothetical protein
VKEILMFRIFGQIRHKIIAVIPELLNRIFIQNLLIHFRNFLEDVDGLVNAPLRNQPLCRIESHEIEQWD